MALQQRRGQILPARERNLPGPFDPVEGELVVLATVYQHDRMLGTRKPHLQLLGRNLFAGDRIRPSRRRMTGNAAGRIVRHLELSGGHARERFCGSRQSCPVIVTGVPTWTLLKNVTAMSSGSRMQPWEAGKPGRWPACMPTPLLVSLIQ